MNHHDLITSLETLSTRRLHWLAKGKIPRHFYMGKTRLIEAIMSLPSDTRAKIQKELYTLIKQTTQKGQAKKRRTSPNWQQGKQVSSKNPPQKDHAGPSSGPTATLETLLEGIGIPPARSFHPDPWQEEAIARLQQSDVIVSVPTGSGKTFVAIEAMRQAIQTDRTVIYTSPLKALSNTKFSEFSHIFGTDQIGILTGDRRDNPEAPILIMTTEILRNLLYDAACGEIDMRLDTLGLVILDESQYLADPERGVVWEETIIFCPSQARLLLLSASIGNPEEVTAWINSIRQTDCYLIQHRNRSVPLRGLYIHPSGKLIPLFKSGEIVQGKGYTLHPETKRLFTQYEEETLGGRFRR